MDWGFVLNAAGLVQGNFQREFPVESFWKLKGPVRSSTGGTASVNLQ